MKSDEHWLERLLFLGPTEEVLRWKDRQDVGSLLQDLATLFPKVFIRMGIANFQGRGYPVGGWSFSEWGMSLFFSSRLYGETLADGLSRNGWRRQEFLHRAVTVLLSAIESPDFHHTGLLCAALWPLRDKLLRKQEDVFDERLAPLLLALDEDQAQSLSEDARRWIRWRLKRRASPEFRVVAFLTLASAGDAKLVPIARALQHTADERVRMAASEALRIVETHG